MPTTSSLNFCICTPSLNDLIWSLGFTHKLYYDGMNHKYISLFYILEFYLPLLTCPHRYLPCILALPYPKLNPDSPSQTYCSTSVFLIRIKSNFIPLLAQNAKEKRKKKILGVNFDTSVSLIIYNLAIYKQMLMAKLSK